MILAGKPRWRLKFSRGREPELAATPYVNLPNPEKVPDPLSVPWKAAPLPDADELFDEV